MPTYFQKVSAAPVNAACYHPLAVRNIDQWMAIAQHHLSFHWLRSHSMHYALVMSITENQNTATKPNTNKDHWKIPKPNQSVGLQISILCNIFIRRMPTSDFLGARRYKCIKNAQWQMTRKLESPSGFELPTSQWPVRYSNHFATATTCSRQLKCH